MNQTLTLAKKELHELFSTPIAYVFLSVFLFLSYWLFFSGIFLIGQTTLRPFFDWMPILFIVFLPAITMGRWSEEYKSGTVEILITLPVNVWQLVVGKFFASLGFLAATLFFTLPLVVTLSWLGDLDLGPVWGSYAGTLFMAGAYIAFGLFVSSLTRNQIIAFLVSVLMLFLFFILAEPIVTNVLPRFLIPAVQFMSFSFHFEPMSRGVISLKSVFYFVSATAVFLYLCALSVNFRRNT